MGALVAALWAFSAGAAVQVSATLDHQSAAVGEGIMLRVIVQDASPDGPPRLPSLPNLRIDDAGTSESISIINGHQSAESTHTYQITPLKPGQYAIPPIQVPVGGRIYTTKPLAFQALPANQAGRGGNPNAPRAAFLKLEAPRSKMYVGEPFFLDAKLYAMTGRLVDEPHLPDTGGFTLGKMFRVAPAREVYDRQDYNTIVYRRLLTATKPGKAEFGPATMVFDPNSNSDAFDFFRARRPQLNLVSDTLELEVAPLPSTNVPAGFAGAIGNFSVRFWASPTNVAVGDPVTVHIQFAGKGAYDAITVPEQADWREFKTYTPTSQTQAGDQYGLVGTNTFEQVVVPQNAEIKELPGFLFSFFNPEIGQYRTIRMPSIPLAVKSSGATPLPSLSVTNASPSGEASSSTEIVHIKPSLGSVVMIGPPLIQRGWFLAIQLAAPLVWAGLGLARRREERLANNPRLRRKRQVDRLVRETIPELRRRAKAGEAEPFHAGAFRILQERLGERLDVAAGGITEEVIDERLRKAGADPALLTGLHEIFKALNHARYAPDASAAELGTLLPKIESALEQLERIKA
jgi:hypothetical protein